MSDFFIPLVINMIYVSFYDGHPGDGPEWVYSLKQDQQPVTGQKIRVVAFDLPNHPGEGVRSL